MQPGLTRQEIDEQLKDIPYTIPEELYQLYEWRNGMSKKSHRNSSYSVFIDSRRFSPLEQVVKIYKQHQKEYQVFAQDDNHPLKDLIKYLKEYLKDKLVIFPPVKATCGAYTVKLGDEKIAPVYNWGIKEEENEEEQDCSLKYQSLIEMMNYYVIEK